MEEMILDTRVHENGNLYNEDLEELQNHGEILVRMSNKNYEAIYKHYQNLWHDYVCRKKIKEEFNNVALMAFFNSIKTKYAVSTLWVIYNCIYSYKIDQYGCNLRTLVKFTTHLKMETSTMVPKITDIQCGTDP